MISYVKGISNTPVMFEKGLVMLFNVLGEKIVNLCKVQNTLHAYI